MLIAAHKWNFFGTQVQIEGNIDPIYLEVLCEKII